MLINADFSLPASVTPDDQRWVASPQLGVERVMLDRVGGEVARATSLVRYAPGSQFPSHKHPGGEEILVLSGTFSDETGDYSAGWYLRNPPGSSHRPSSLEGALILVKLHQMGTAEHGHVRIDSTDPSHWLEVQTRHLCPLFGDGVEQVFLQRLADGEALESSTSDDLELFILSGALTCNGVRYGGGSWIRLPRGGRRAIKSEGASTVYVKSGSFLPLSCPSVES